jgi:periplasmic divalent cation tolerance protein
MQNLSIIYTTINCAETAEKMAQTLLQENLIACANIIEGYMSLYVSDGKLQKDREVILILKTLPTKLTDLSARIIQLHPYQTPCVMELPATCLSKKFLDWIAAHVHQ